MAQNSVLTSGQKKLFAGIAILAVFILANSLFLYLNNPTARNSDLNEQRYEFSTYGMNGVNPIVDNVNPESSSVISQFYQIMLLSHIFIGVGLFLVVTSFVVWHLRNAMKRKNYKAIVMGTSLAVAATLITLSGLFILTEANSLQNRWIFYGHRIIAVIIPFLYLAHRYTSSPLTFKKHAIATVGVVTALFAFITVIHNGTMPEIEKGEIIAAIEPAYHAEEISDPFIPFTYKNNGHPDSPFFPSAVTTESGGYIEDSILTQKDYVHQDKINEELDQYGFLVSQTIGSDTCARCHEAIVEQWSKSAHRFSSFNNPFYKASIDDLHKAENGKQRSQWCAGCHDPALLFTGNMLKDVDPQSHLAQVGLACLACHIIDGLHGKEGGGNFNLASLTPSTYLFSESKTGVTRLMGDMVIKAKPTVHKNLMLKPFFRSSEYCMTCHKVSLDEPVNQYRWIRGQDEYDNWHDSGVALNASRTFYLPPKKRSCQECHMPLEEAELPDVSAKNGMVKSHRFLAVNTALPYIRGDMETIERIEAFLKDEKMAVDIFAIRTGDGETINVLDKDQPFIAKAGETIQVDVVVRNKNVGHTFPGGTNDSNEGWIGFQVSDNDGNLIFESGSVDEEGHVDPNAHFYKVLFVDKNGNPALKRNAQDFHVLVYARVIGPGTTDAVRFRFTVPEEADGKQLTMNAKLLWRKFNQDFNKFVFDNQKVPDVPHLEGKQYPDLPITEIASDTKSIAVSNQPNPEKTHDPAEWIRYNDYGIAHFLDQDLKTAEWAFQTVKDIVPERIDGDRNLARIAITEGRLEEAFAYLEKCEQMKPGDPQTAWFWGLARKDDGKYEEAAKAFERVLAYFPEDRASWNNLGRSYYLNGEYEKSLKAYLTTLQIDPEDRTAHYHRMLIYRAMGKTMEAKEAEKAYLKYKIDESAAEITQKYRLNHPADNTASQSIIIYDLLPLPSKQISSNN